MPKADNTPETLLPYLQHKLELTWQGGSEASADCPFCGYEGRFYVSQQSGMYHCKACSGGPKAGPNGGGNIFNFIRGLHDISVTQTEPEMLDLVAEERKIFPETLARWGLAQSALDGEWILPAYGPKGEINNLYRWVKVKDKRRLMGTKGLDACLFGTQFGFYTSKKPVYIPEGVWNAMAMEDACRQYKISNGSFVKCFPEDSFRTTIEIIGVPGAETFKDEWIPWFKGREVFLGYDSDYPRRSKKTNAEMPPAGYSGMQAVARKLNGVASEVNYIYWGPEGYNSELKPGYDVRDFLTETP